MTHLNRKSGFAVFALALGLGLNVWPSWGDESCVVPSLSVSLHEKFTPEGELASVSRLKLEKKLGRPPGVQMEILPGRTVPRLLPEKHSGIAVIYESGTRIGSVEFHTEGDVLVIDLLSVIPDYQKAGIASTLIESVVKMNPHIKQMRAVMADDNEEALHEAMERGLPPDLAILETPSYKIHAKLGFSRVVSGSVKDISLKKIGRYEFTVERRQ